MVYVAHSMASVHSRHHHLLLSLLSLKRTSSLFLPISHRYPQIVLYLCPTTKCCWDFDTKITSEKNQIKNQIKPCNELSRFSASTLGTESAIIVHPSSFPKSGFSSSVFNSESRMLLGKKIKSKGTGEPRGLSEDFIHAGSISSP